MLDIHTREGLLKQEIDDKLASLSGLPMDTNKYISVVYFNIYLHPLYILISKNTHYLSVLPMRSKYFIYISLMTLSNLIFSVLPTSCKILICREWTFMVCQKPFGDQFACIVNVSLFCILYYFKVFFIFLLKLWPNTANKWLILFICLLSWII